ncbi:hypothetical protein Hanom_Chr09g00787371 [Helianthus anomalus]
MLVHTEDIHVTPPQQHQSVLQPSSTTKKPATPREFDHVEDFVATFGDINLGSGPTPNIEDISDIPSFDEDERIEARLAKLEQDKAASDEKLKHLEDKLKNVEAENVVLKNEVLVLNEKVEELQAGNVSLNEVVNGLLTTNEQLMSTNASLSVENEIFKKVMEDLQANKEIKTKQLEKLYYDQNRIRRAKARRIERERKAAKDVAESSKDKGKGKVDNVPDISQFNLVGMPVNVPYSKEETTRRIEVERQHLKTKTYNKDEEEDDEEEDDDFQDIDDYHGCDDKGDDDDDDQGGNGGMLIVKHSGVHQAHDFLDDSRNEEHEDVQPQGESTSGVVHDEPANMFSNTLKVIYLNHDVEEGEIVENWTSESMMEMLDINDENFKFDIEDDISKATPDGVYVFKMVDVADNFNNVVVEDDSESDQEEPFHYSNELKRKVGEKVSEDGVPKTLSKEELLEERKKWFKPMVEERKFKRPLKFFTRHQDQSLGDILSWGYLEDLESEANFPVWKPHYPKRIVKVDPVTGEKDITLHIKRPRCRKNVPLKEMEQDFYKDFKEWVYNPSTCEAVITIQDEKCIWRYIQVLDPMWLVHCSKKDIECLFFNKIMYYPADKKQTMQYQKLINVYFKKDINSGHY